MKSRLARLSRSDAFKLFALLFVTFAFFYPGGGHNENARYDLIRSVVEDHHVWIDKYIYNSADVISYQDRHWYSGKAPGAAFLAIPAFAISDSVLSLLPLKTAGRYHLVCYLTSLFSVGLLSAFCGVCVYLFLVRIGATRFQSIAVTLLIVLGTLIFPFSTLLFSHVATAALLFASFFLIFALCDGTRAVQVEVNIADSSLSGPSRPGIKKVYLLVAGFACGFALGNEYPAIFGIVLIHLYAAYKLGREKRWREWLLFVAGSVIGVLPLLIYNELAFSRLTYVPYEGYADPNAHTFAAVRKGILGVRIPFIDAEFTPIFLNNLREITYRPLRGLFVFSPVLLFVIPGFFIAMAKRWRSLVPEISLSAALFVCYLVFTATYGDSIVYWGGGTSFGPRHLIPMLPFLALPLWLVLRTRYLGWITAMVGLVSIFFALMGSAIEPRTPYWLPNGMLGFYLPRFVNGEFATSGDWVFSPDLFTRDSVAFNLGKLTGLHAQWELWPLYAIWLAGAIWLGCALPKNDARKLIGVTTGFVALLALLPLFAR